MIAFLWIIKGTTQQNRRSLKNKNHCRAAVQMKGAQPTSYCNTDERRTFLSSRIKNRYWRKLLSEQSQGMFWIYAMKTFAHLAYLKPYCCRHSMCFQWKPKQTSNPRMTCEYLHLFQVILRRANFSTSWAERRRYSLRTALMFFCYGSVRSILLHIRICWCSKCWQFRNCCYFTDDTEHANTN